ncbi:unnamed protein product [Nippostrongylus brasiliensis]|uniref:Plasmodium variant antigen protein Cir/Yir/Bir n=1 Tax=Nippostrongylus brasiliensis TaxID=27835 RepID=A0A0N4YZJ4_NIPBR|nr:unnamed protein product [Nippostrongylus brasiliensis]
MCNCQELNPDENDDYTGKFFCEIFYSCSHPIS